MPKLIFILYFSILNITLTIEDINSFSTLMNLKSNIRNLKSSKNKNFFQNKKVKIMLVLISLIIGVIGGIIYAIRNRGRPGPDISDWEYLFRRRDNRKKDEKELLKKKKKYYLLNYEIKGFKYNKEYCNNEVECPICLENYSIEKDVCFTPCKHLFHHNCLKEYIYGCEEMKCPICKFDMWECLKDKNINYAKIKIKEKIFEMGKTNKKNNLINANNETINSNNITLNSNNEGNNLNVPVEN